MTVTLGDISVRYVNLMLKTAQNLEVDIRSVCNQFNLPDELLNQGGARVSIPKYMRLGHHLINATGIREFGLRCGANSTLATLGMAGFLAASANTLEQALCCVIDYESLNSKNARGQSSAHIQGERFIAQFYSISPYNEFNCFVVDLALSIQVALIAQLTDKPVPLQRVEIEYPAPANANSYSDFFNCPVHFAQSRNALIYQRTDLQAPCYWRDNVTFKELRQLCEQQKLQLDRSLSLRERVMDEISPLLAGANVSIEQVALRLDLPPWTLRRKLKEEGVLFRELVDATRKALALIYIRDAQYSLGEIAYLLGFAHPAAFQRAFRRWTGLAPGRFRDEGS
jgi:AraC-like DNA-binding protein